MRAGSDPLRFAIGTTAARVAVVGATFLRVVLCIAAITLPATPHAATLPPDHAGSDPARVDPASADPSSGNFTGGDSDGADGAEPGAVARRIAGWAFATDDAGGLPFLIVDKRAAALHVFDSNGRLTGSSPVLLGLARGDDSVPGIGERPIAKIRPHERTTPAGRFIAERGVNVHGEDIMWIDYDDAISMHRVRATNPKERRLERLRTPSIEDNRISYGCINVPVAFYERRVVPAFAAGIAVVYVLPEERPLHDYFRLDPKPVRSADGNGIGSPTSMPSKSR